MKCIYKDLKWILKCIYKGLNEYLEWNVFTRVSLRSHFIFSIILFNLAITIFHGCCVKDKQPVIYFPEWKKNICILITQGYMKIWVIKCFKMLPCAQKVNVDIYSAWSGRGI